MNLFRAFMELDEINEGLSRQEIISRLRALGKRYNFDRFPDKQLYGMLRDAEEEKARENTDKKVNHELDLDFESAKDFACCDFCGMRLNDSGQCPTCDLGEEDLNEEAFKNNTSSQLTEWVTASGKQIKLTNNNTLQQNTQPSQSRVAQAQQPNNNKYVVQIVSDKGRLRALATDGVHPEAWVSFPNHLRQFDGQKYEVDQLIWNGKNYRVAGNIVEI